MSSISINTDVSFSKNQSSTPIPIPSSIDPGARSSIQLGSATLFNINNLATKTDLLNAVLASMAKVLGIRTEATAISLDADDAGFYIIYTGSDPINVAIANVLPIYSVVTFRQRGAGTITLVADTDETLYGAPTTNGQHFAIQLIKTADKTYDIIGGVE